jgi:hypothetical protein
MEGNAMAPLTELHVRGQSVWLDEIRREWLEDGTLEELIQRGVTGVTSNPTIFERAITSSPAYNDPIRTHLLRDPEMEVAALYEALAVEDIRLAADLLRPVYEATEGGDGYVSLEVSPHLAHDTEGTIAEARRLWRAVDRPNLMIKVPATPAGIPAIEALIAQGVNVNVTRPRGFEDGGGPRPPGADRRGRGETGLPALPGAFPPGGLSGSRRPGGTGTTGLVGQHQHQEPGLL